MRPSVLAGTAAAGAAVAATAAYSSVLERNWFALRRYDVPVLAPGAGPVRLLHMSDAHLTPGRHRLMSWLRSLAALEPDLVVNTGDSIAHPRALGPFLDAVGPLLEVPGVFVFGSNDFYAPTVRNPARYLWRTTAREHEHHSPDLPWPELAASLTAAGWLNASNQRGRLKAGGLEIEVGGVDDPHVHRDRYDLIAGPADPAAGLRLGVMHSPEPALMDRFVADGYDLLLAGHTHGGQVCLPFFGALVTNCGIDRRRASGLHRHPARGDPARGSPAQDGGPSAWLHVSAGLGTSPTAPVRFCCRPSATLLTLIPSIS